MIIFILQKKFAVLCRSAGMVDGADSKSAEGNLMGVRVPPSAPVKQGLKPFFI